MDKLEALKGLLKNVETERLDKGRPYVSEVFILTDRLAMGYHGAWVKKAYHGSLDAAKALHEAVLPGWVWLIRSSDECDVITGTCHHGQFLANVWRDCKSPNEGEECFPVWGLDPARAWLCAVLKALIAQEQEG